jgi:hypothetical protein
MSEAPQDIAYVKLTSSQVVTPEVTPTTQGVWAEYEVVNIGTAPTDHDHDISWGVAYMGAQMFGDSHQFDPALEANGGSYKGAVHVGMEHLQFEGDWELVIQCDLGINKGISDSVHLPFKVSLHDHTASPDPGTSY